MSKRERIEALEARVAALEASNTPGGLEGAPDNTPGGPPEPVPQWRAMVDAGESAIWGDGTVSAEHALSRVLHDLATLASGDGGWQIRTLARARIVAVAEGQVGDGWQADPSRVPHGHWGIAWLLTPLSHEPPNWVVVADRSAAWLRSLTDGAS